MSTIENLEYNNVIEYSVNIVSAYVSNNVVVAADLPQIIHSVHSALWKLSEGNVKDPLEVPKPAVNPKKSITPEYLVCLEDGKRFKSLKRHLRTHYDLSPDAYRERWSLPADYPMVAPKYAAARSTLAKQMGLGQKK
ncbi:MAG: MucR family transcriptional regulator [Alphaproteobacteria bacterium]|nr:MucR family transcriptional regulator [Alphaproteobacteria bacterium]